jgi:hypothetical protein
MAAKIERVLARASTYKNAAKFSSMNTKKKLICSKLRSTILKITRKTKVAAPSIKTAFLPG